MSMIREAWLGVLQDADGQEETELVTIERSTDGAPPIIEVPNGVRVACTEPAVGAGVVGHGAVEITP